MINRKRLLILVVLALAAYGFLSQITGFGDSITALRQAHLGWVLIALCFTCLSYALAAAVYVCIATRLIAIGVSTLVQVAGNFANRLLPAGSGAIAINYDYLRRQHHTAGEATAVVVVNNVLGFVGNMLLLLLFIIFSTVQPKAVQLSHIPLWLIFGGIAILVAAGDAAAIHYGKRLKGLLKSVRATLAVYRQHPGQLLLGLAASMALSLSYALCLLACSRAVSLHLTLPVIFISMSLGVAGATATPTPGGIGGAEAALLAALILYGADRPTALAAVLLYRICTFWLPLVLGPTAFIYARKQRYI